MKKYYKIILIALWVGFIYYNSLQPANISSAQSFKFVTFFQNIFLKLGINISTDTLSLIIRKGAHMFEYFVLALLFSIFYKDFVFSKKRLFCYIFFSTILISVFDEVIQTFVVGRSGSIVDVGIDMLGGLIGIGLAFIFIYRKREKKNK